MQIDNLLIKSNIRQVKPQQPLDYKGQPVDLEARIFLAKKQGGWNKELGAFNKYVSNKETVVKEFQYEMQQQSDSQRNFIKDFFKDQSKTGDELKEDYLENMLHKVVNKYYTDMISSYNKAINFKTEQVTKETLKSLQLTSNLKKSKLRVTSFMAEQDLIDEEEQVNFKQWIQGLYRMVQEIVQHILAAAGEKKFKRMTQLIQEKEHITTDVLKEDEKNKKTCKDSLNQLGNLRLLISKKTDEFDMLKQIHGDDFLSDSTIMQELSESVTNAGKSQHSETLSIAQDQLQKKTEESKISKFGNLKQLKCIWRIDDEHKIKQLLRRLFVKQLLSEAERLKVKQKREEEEMRQKMIQDDPTMANLFKAQDQMKKKKSNQITTERQKEILKKKKKKQDQEKDLQETVIRRNNLLKVNPKQQYENKIKDGYFSTNSNLFLSVGEIFERTKNYASLFKQRVNENEQSSIKE